jgi:hypothetical protein
MGTLASREMPSGVGRRGVGVGVWVGVEVKVGVVVGVGVRVCVAVAVAVGVRVGVRVAVGEGVRVGVAVGVGKGVLVDVAVEVPAYASRTFPPGSGTGILERQYAALSNRAITGNATIRTTASRRDCNPSFNFSSQWLVPHTYKIPQLA